MKIQTVKVIALSYLSITAPLGFYRGIQYEKYRYDCLNSYYKKNNKPLYGQYIGVGMRALMLYITPPIFIVYMLPKEMYRLEVNLRGLKKDFEYYNLV